MPAVAGAGLPGGSVKAVADTAGGDNQGGYVSDGSAVLGISQLHDDGTGGSPSLGEHRAVNRRPLCASDSPIRLQAS